MSAYICNPEHIGLLAAWATGYATQNAVIYDWRNGGTLQDDAARVALELWKENVRSVAARYPRDTLEELPGPCLSPDDQALAVMAYARHYVEQPFRLQALKPVDVIQLCMGYEYQASETDSYSDTLAARQIKWILGKAYRLLPGYDNAPWEYTEKNPIPAVEALYEKCAA